MSAVETHTPDSRLARIRRDGVRGTAQAFRRRCHVTAKGIDGYA